jgi:hypothetical protein
MAAAQSELGEVAMLQGAVEDALGLYSESIRTHERAGRRAAAYRSEAGRQRAMAVAGATPLTNRLDEGIAWAEERALPVLETDLRTARGRVLAGSDVARAIADLDASIATADHIGARIRAGRARLYRFGLIPGDAGARRRGLAEAEELLADHQPWLWRVKALQAQASGVRVEMARAAARFDAMGMEIDAAQARTATGE